MEYRAVTYAPNAKLAAYRSVLAHGAVSGADPHALVLTLMDAALERMTAALGCLERGELVRKTQLLHSSVRLVTELRGSLNLKDGGELAANLSGLYDYMVRRLLLANATNDPQRVTEALEPLRSIRGAWAAIAPAAKQAATQPGAR
jgi:flagellar secretion chaperone FliS